MTGIRVGDVDGLSQIHAREHLLRVPDVVYKNLGAYIGDCIVRRGGVISPHVSEHIFVPDHNAGDIGNAVLFYGFLDDLFLTLVGSVVANDDIIPNPDLQVDLGLFDCFELENKYCKLLESSELKRTYNCRQLVTF